MNAEIQDKKIELIQWLSTLEDTTIIDKLLKLRRATESDFWDTISEDEKHSLTKGLTDAENKKLKDHTSAKMIYEKWL